MPFDRLLPSTVSLQLTLPLSFAASTCTTAQSNLDLPTANTVPYCFVLERKCIGTSYICSELLCLSLTLAFASVVCDLGYLGPQADGSCTAVVKCPANPAHGVYVGKDCTLGESQISLSFPGHNSFG